MLCRVMSDLEPKPQWEPRYLGSNRLRCKVAIITGADSSIGRAVAALYPREGADVAGRSSLLLNELCEQAGADLPITELSKAEADRCMDELKSRLGLA